MTGFDPWRTRLLVDGFILPVWSYIGIVETWSEVDQIEKRRDVNGGVCVLRPLWGKKYKIGLSASGNAIRWVPAFEKLDKGDVVRLESSRFMLDQILIGQPSTTLARDPVTDSIKVWAAGDRNETRLPFTVDGRLVSVAAPPTVDLVVAYRPVFYVTRNSSSGTHPEIDGRVEWQCEFEEA